MPRESKSQTTIRAGGGESQIDAPSERVISGNLRVDNPYVKVVKARTNGQLKMADAVANFAKTTKQVIGEHQARKEKKDALAGTQAALAGENPGLETYRETMAANAADPNRSAAYMEGYAAQAGRMAGHTIINELQGELQDGNFGDETQVNGFMQAKLQEGLEGIDDEAYRAQVLSAFADNEGKLRENWKEAKQAEVLEELTVTYNGAMRNDFRKATMDGATPAELHTQMTTYFDQAALMGIDRNTAAESMLLNVEEAATIAERPEMFRAFEMSRQSLEDPTLTIPGLANSPKFQAKILDAKGRVERKISAKQDVRKQQKKYAVMNDIKRTAEDMSFNQARQKVDAAVEDGYYTADGGMAAKKKIDEQEKLVNNVALAQRLAGNGEMSQGDEYGLTKKELQLGFTTWAREALANATPEEMPATQMLIVERGIENGGMLLAHKNLLNTVSPAQAEEWAEAADIRMRYRNRDPQFFSQEVSDEQEMAFIMYDNMIERYIPEEAARAALMKIGDPEHAEKVMKTEKAYYDKKIEEELLTDVDVVGYFKDQDMENTEYVRGFVKDGARLYLAQTNGDVKSALEYGITAFEKTHTAVKRADGKFYYVPHAGRPLGKNFEPAVAELNAKLKAKWGKSVQNSDEQGYYLAPNPYNPNGDVWTVMKMSTNTPVVVDDGNGRGRPKTVNRLELVAEFDRNEVKANTPQPKSARVVAYEQRNKAIERAEKAERLKQQQYNNSVEGQRARIEKMHADKTAQQK